MNDASWRSSQAEGRKPSRPDREDLWERIGMRRDGPSETSAEGLSALDGEGAGSASSIEIDSTLNEREGDYGLFGDFADKAEFSQKLKSMVDDSFGWVEFASPAEKEALHMIIHKISRVVWGNPSHVDSWLDIAGYAMLVVKHLENKTSS